MKNVINLFILLFILTIGPVLNAKDINFDDYIIKIKKGFTLPISFFEKNSDIVLKSKSNYPFGRYITVNLKSKGAKSLERKINFIKKNNFIQYIEPNFLYSLITLEKHRTLKNKSRPSDDRFKEQWNFENTGSNYPNPFTKIVPGADIDVIRAWEITKGSKDIVIAIVDTGVDYNHPDLLDNIWINEQELDGINGVDDDKNGFIDDIRGYNFSKGNNDPFDDFGHGTNCAGIIGASHNNIGIAGIMGKVSIMSLKFLNKYGDGTAEQAMKAIYYAVDNGAHIISNSWGGGDYSKALEDAIQYANSKGVIFTVAAGNSGENNDNVLTYPASYKIPNIISVASHGADDLLPTFSNYGETSVDIVAPGKRIWSTSPNNEIKKMSGTSMSTPHVTGAIGLLLSLGQKFTPREIKQRLQLTSIPSHTYRKRTISGGRLSIYNLLTDTTPERVSIPEKLWLDYKLDIPFETEHPYQSYTYIKKTVVIPNAKYIRAVVAKYDIRPIYDYLSVRVDSTFRADRVSGSGQDYYTNYVVGEKIDLKFSSAASKGHWGILIEKIQYIPNL